MYRAKCLVCHERQNIVDVRGRCGSYERRICVIRGDYVSYKAIICLP